MTPNDQRKANNALGICLLSSIALLETIFADHKMPNPASPYVWAALGLTAGISLIVHLRLRLRDRG
jgi:hypothetical protein